MIRTKKYAAAALLAAMTILLSACLLIPGRFQSAMNVRSDGQFAFQYSGEIVLLPLAEKAKKRNEPFEPEPCRTDDGDSERKCTSAEIAEQKARWEQRKSGKPGEAEMAKSFLGGLDPSDPKAGQQFAEKLSRQAGWRHVAYKGDGVFDVEFAVSGMLEHDFVFPTIEGFPMANAFVQVFRRNDGSLRVEAPGFGPEASGMPMQGMMMGAMLSEGKGGTKSSVPGVAGTFALRTDAQILANNTDEGPQADPAGQKLEWKIEPGSKAAPTALLKLSR